MRIRKRLLIDHKVQGALMLRAVEYWFCSVLTIGLALLIWKLVTHRQSLPEYFVDAWHYFVVAGIVSVLALPVLIYDALRMSNRFTGPLYRLRRELRRLAAGEHVSPIRFRDGDFWPDLADEFNATSERMEMLADRAENARKSTSPASHVGAGNESPDARQTSANPNAAKSQRNKSDDLKDLELPDNLFELPRNLR